MERNAKEGEWKDDSRKERGKDKGDSEGKEWKGNEREAWKRNVKGLHRIDKMKKKEKDVKKWNGNESNLGKVVGQRQENAGGNICEGEGKVR